MHSGMLVLLLILGVSHLHADMWEIIAKQNKKFLESRGQQDDNGERIVGGDIYMRVDDWAENRKVFDKKPKIQHSPQNAPRYQQLQPIFDYHRKLWKRKIPYVITSSISKHASVIKSSLKKISDASCLTFYQVREGGGGQNNWLEFYRGQGCFSGIGRQYYRKSATRISLGSYCEVESIIVHEVLHALGFFHEQSRSDRDSYLTINMNKVQSSMKSNFKKNEPFETDYAGTPYDVDSIMQYGNTAFRLPGASGDVMQNKYDPGHRLGGNVLSKYDILELNRRYQCSHVDLDGKRVAGVMTGYSQWSEFSKCGSNWRGECSKARYRFCVDSDNCKDANEYGTQEEVVECPKLQCEKNEKSIDGIWGSWGEFSECAAKCGWGIQTRTRKCDNPSPSNNPKGKPCEGFNMERRSCRKARCTGAERFDQNFNNGFGSWQSQNFERQRGKIYGVPYGPSKDHTSIVEGKTGGYYAAAKKTKGFARTDPTARLTSPALPSIQKQEWCLSFYYLLNGPYLHKTKALRIYLKYRSGGTSKDLFVKGGHVSKDWRMGMVPLSNIQTDTKIVFESQFQSYEGSVVGIDDIVVDNNKCPDGLAECKDIDNDCEDKANKGYCWSYWRYMLRKCCKTCQDPKFKIDSLNKPKATCEDVKSYASDCVKWSKSGECQKNAVWMKKNCCDSCKKHGKETSSEKQPACKNNSDYKTKCLEWAKQGECAANKWMLKNCCESCNEFCVNKNSKCDEWAKSGECKKNSNWMKRNCCKSCQQYGKQK